MINSIKGKNAEYKNCPYCGERIKKIAKKCKLCNEWLGIYRYWKYFGTLFNGIVALCAILSLIFGIYQYQRGKKAKKKEEQTAAILKKIPHETISDIAKKELKPKGKLRFRTVFPEQLSRERAKKIEELISKGQEALEAGREDVAQKFYLEAARLERASPQIQRATEALVPKALGYFYLYKGDPEKAKEEFEEALKRNPRDIGARTGQTYSEILSW